MNPLTYIPLSELKGIGTSVSEKLNKLGIHNIDDLITYYPFRYDILERTNLLNTKHDSKVTVDGIVENNPLVYRYGRRKSRMTFQIRTNETIVKVTIFNRDFLKNKLTYGQTVTVIGKYDLYKNSITASDILFSPLPDIPEIIPVYKKTEGITSKQINKYIEKGISIYNKGIEDILPLEIKDKYRLISKLDALNMVHFPKTKEHIRQARRRLKYEELLEFNLKMQAMKFKYKKQMNGIMHNFKQGDINSYIEKLPFKLTSDQETVTNEILDDLRSNIIMNRLVQGDVGSGKTVVAAIAMYSVYLSGYQCALMAPTEILAEQHYKSLIKLFDDFNIKIELLTGSMKMSTKNDIYEKLETGQVDIIIGTHSLIQDAVKFRRLGLVITDEQHRFGVNQRAILRNKGESVDMLNLSATPIPRTLAITLFGNMDVSTIKTMPRGRKPIETYLKKKNEIKDVLGLMYNEIQSGRQVYVIVPLIEESETLELMDSYKTYEKLKEVFKDKATVGLLHGKMTSLEKDEVMDKYNKNEINILVSTTVVEVGVNVPNASVMVIFDADRFGLSQLHQLRGRVGRGEYQSYCILISDNEKERLEVMTLTNDGFEISEADLKLRGPGDLFGSKQSGDLDFKLANIVHDYKIVETARDDAIKLIKSDEIYNNPHYEHIKGIVNRILEKRFD